jgi:hypothetical protein
MKHFIPSDKWQIWYWPVYLVGYDKQCIKRTYLISIDSTLIADWLARGVI